MNAVTFTNGNKKITLTTGSAKEWAAGDKARIYFDLKCDQKRQPVAKFYEVISGATADKTVVREDGRTFAYEYGIDANSGSKRESIDAAMIELAASL